MESVALGEPTKGKYGCCGNFSRWLQDSCYQLFARTVWDQMVSGFMPGRVRAFELLDIQQTDHILLVGEGTGADFECLPEDADKKALRAFDFSPEMVKQCKIKAERHGIPEENCFVGDAQRLPFKGEKFHKIYFPLSLASIPNPTLALSEAARVLASGGKIVIFEKLIDDGVTVSSSRRVINLITRSVFADINRNLSGILKPVSSLKLVHYESLGGRLNGIFAGSVGRFYRLAVVVRGEDFPNKPAVSGKIKAE